jgi:hypothetical protein
MNLLRSRWSTTCAAVGLGCLLVSPAPARAQTFVELGGGWNFVGSASSGTSYGGGSSFRASIGWQAATNFRWRIDALTNEFDNKTILAQPCPSFGCSGPPVYGPSEHVNGLTANGLVNVDQRGILYVIGGAGIYDAHAQKEDWLFGVSAGAGIAIPVVPHLHAVVEARWHGLLGSTSGPTWFVPITVGLRY